MIKFFDVTARAYEEKVYAGVLGKIVGVYLGRPFEQWSHERIERELGEIHYYVHEKLGQPLIVTDDDISGTFTFLRALTENGFDPDLTPAQIGDWWLNSIIENRTILWWGGFGLSTEHTAYLRLKAGLHAPESGSIARNGICVAEEIGAQIFIDGWGLICPGDPCKAADFARRAASVSHDGEAIYGAQVIAALVALAFVETDILKMLTAAQALIPEDSLISTLITDMQQWAAQNGDDWRATLARIHEVYPYARFGTNCPMVSNHAIILLALLHGKGEFQRSLMIACTAGYDTDCNSGNVGCILGVLTGLAGIDAGPDWRGPVADRLYLPTADGGRAITDAVRETYEIVKAARALAGAPFQSPKNGARFHFSLPGSVQGWEGDGLTVRNAGGRLALDFAGNTRARAGTATFAAFEMGSYSLIASPTLYTGQTITAAVQAAGTPCSARLYIKVTGDSPVSVLRLGPMQTLEAGEAVQLAFTVPDTDGQPVHEVGLELSTDAAGTAFLDWLTWGGPPRVTFGRPGAGGEAWSLAWVSGADQFSTHWTSPGWTYRVIQNAGAGLVTQGEASWRDYTVAVDVWPHLSQRIGLCAACQGLRRYVALVLDTDKRIRLVHQRDDTLTVLAESDQTWAYERKMSLSLTVSDGLAAASVGGHLLFAADAGLPLSGAIGLLVEQGNAEFGPVEVRPERHGSPARRRSGVGHRGADAGYEEP